MKTKAESDNEKASIASITNYDIDKDEISTNNELMIAILKLYEDKYERKQYK